MQDLTKSLILLNGELKTLQIASISKWGANAFRVCFKNNPRSYIRYASKNEVLREFGGIGMSASGLVENLVRLHLETYREDIKRWRKL